eukprot:TRINITY_DN4580_c0_g1_i1.p1 TRINITY_DN4580_c0_g1~~TRINITY_DN4580_c0_g1_i1.p1  ORF type:complete len:474 (-),score=106.70 TRINITY_DN4580_c0_g1_i1:58-1398(-)
MADLGQIDDEEADLFGSDDDAAAPIAAAPAETGDTAAAAAPAKVGDQDAMGDEDDLSEKDLFGSEDDGEDLNEAELFGSEEEEAADDKAKPTEGEPAAGTPLPAPSEISEMDERDVFGDVSDDEPEKEEDLTILRRPAPPADRVFMTMRLPNVLGVEKTSFRGPDSIPQSQLEGYREYKNTQGKNVVKLLNPENCMRWRFKKGPDGGIMTDDIGRPRYESNARIVEWEDGSQTLFVGAESFNVTSVEDRVAIFEENSKDAYVCHGTVNKRLVATPREMNSASHESLKRAQYRKYEPVRRSLLMTEADTEEAKQLEAMEREEKKRREKAQQRAVQDSSLPGMSVGFLEDDDTAQGPSLADIKRQHRGPDGRPAKRPKGETGSSPASGPSSGPPRGDSPASGPSPARPKADSPASGPSPARPKTDSPASGPSSAPPTPEVLKGGGPQL